MKLTYLFLQCFALALASPTPNLKQPSPNAKWAMRPDLYVSLDGIVNAATGDKTQLVSRFYEAWIVSIYLTKDGKLQYYDQISQKHGLPETPVRCEEGATMCNGHPAGCRYRSILGPGGNVHQHGREEGPPDFQEAGRGMVALGISNSDAPEL